MCHRGAASLTRPDVRISTAGAERRIPNVHGTSLWNAHNQAADKLFWARLIGHI